MRDYLKNYQVRISACAPIHIGSGQKTGKKEYIYIPWKHQVIIPDFEKMYQGISRKGLQQKFTDYMMNPGEKTTLSQWLAQHKFGIEDYEHWKKYAMDAGEAFTIPTAKPKDIDTFVKDAYGLPYVPGSSIKGMFRTALLAAEIQKDPGNYMAIRQEIDRTSRIRADRKRYLSNETNQLEQKILYTLNRDEKKKSNAVNDCLSGLHVGDSVPVALEQLTLSQKIDYTLDGREKPLPLLRESLIPGTEICFPVSIDTTVCPYDMQEITDSLNIFHKICQKYFYSRFHRGSNDANIVWLGGGCGFLSKTVLYALFEKEAYRVTNRIYQNTLGKNYEVHKHGKDTALKLAPHVCKCTRYQGTLYDMGMGQISFEKC